MPNKKTLRRSIVNVTKIVNDAILKRSLNGIRDDLLDVLDNVAFEKEVVGRLSDVPTHGSWKDLEVLYRRTASIRIKTEIVKLFSEGVMDNNIWCCKYSPREGKANNELRLAILEKTKLTPKRYRKILSSMSHNLIERVMSEKRLDEVSTSLLSTHQKIRYRKALQKSAKIF